MCLVQRCSCHMRHTINVWSPKLATVLKSLNHLLPLLNMQVESEKDFQKRCVVLFIVITPRVPRLKIVFALKLGLKNGNENKRKLPPRGPSQRTTSSCLPGLKNSKLNFLVCLFQ